MRQVKCYDCGRRYDYDVDDFCPRCGAFTQPARTSHIGADGSVVRLDGISEKNHQNSFVHREFHAEERKRRGTWLEGTSEKKREAIDKKRSTPVGRKGRGNVVAKIVFVIIILNVLSSLLSVLF